MAPLFILNWKITLLLLSRLKLAKMLQLSRKDTIKNSSVSRQMTMQLPLYVADLMDEFPSFSDYSDYNFTLNDREVITVDRARLELVSLSLTAQDCQIIELVSPAILQ